MLFLIYQELIQSLHHCLVTLTIEMYRMYRNGKNGIIVHQIIYLEYSLLFVHNNDVVIIIVFFSKLHLYIRLRMHLTF